MLLEHTDIWSRPWNALSFEDTVRVRTFLIDYAAKHARLLPGRYPGYRNFCTQLLESHLTKEKIHQLYVQSSELLHKLFIDYRLFSELWNILVPYIIIPKPQNDLCTDCQQNNFLIWRTADEEDEKKKAKLAKQEEHLYRSEREPLFYQLQCKQAKEEL